MTEQNKDDGQRGLGNVRIGSFAAGMVLQQAKCPVDYKMGQDQGRVACTTCAGYSSAAPIVCSSASEATPRSRSSTSESNGAVKPPLV